MALWDIDDITWFLILYHEGLSIPAESNEVINSTVKIEIKN